MQIGPNGEIRPDDPTERAAMAFKIATGEMEEQYIHGSPRPMTWEERQTAAKTRDRNKKQDQ